MMGKLILQYVLSEKMFIEKFYLKYLYSQILFEKLYKDALSIGFASTNSFATYIIDILEWSNF